MKSRHHQTGAIPAKPADSDQVTGSISILGARANNLQGVGCDIRKHELVCVCGVSGSGKSSLLFSVLAAESQARHELLLADPRRKSEASRAPADAITGLPFSVTVSQRGLRAQKRSTVATQTGIQRDLIFLVRHAGRIRCSCGMEVGPPSAADLMAAIQRARQKAVRVSAVMFRQGWGGNIPHAAVRVGTAIKQLEEGGKWLPVPPRGGVEDVEACAVRVGEYQLGPELEHALASAAADSVGVLVQSTEQAASWRLDTSREWPCPTCGIVHPRATDSLLSFNSAPERSGRCPNCAGLGTTLEVDLDLIVIEPKRPTLDGALGLERRGGSFRHLGVREDTVRGVIRGFGASEATAWGRLPQKVQQTMLQGTGRREQPLDVSGRKTGAKVLYHGLVPALIRLADKSGEAGDYARSFVTERPCPQCNGRRYDAMRVAQYEYRGESFLDWLDKSSHQAACDLRAVANDKARQTGPESVVLPPCIRKLEALDRSGLGHLALGRSTATLSGGELQRLKISRSLVGGLVNSCFILDEPSSGLHAADNEGMIRNLRELRNAGNTVLLADHDPDFIQGADARIFLGPGAGQHGGRILSRDVPMPHPFLRVRKSASTDTLTISGCTLHNMREQTVALPLGRLVCLTGVSGSGKSTFAKGILVPALKAALAHGRHSGPSWKLITGTEQVRTVLAIGQTSLSRSRRSLVATYVGVAEPIRALLAATELARQREYTSATFSANRPEGWCPACSGLGVLVEEDAVQSAAPVCDACRGGRFRDAILDCCWRGRSVADILDLEVAEALDFFVDEKEITRRLAILGQLGLGHLKLGRATSTFSGGEAQRLRLAAGIAENREGVPSGVFFVLDEPTAGLHGSDIQALLELLERLLSEGRNTVVIIEHDLSVIRASDYVIDFGPGSAADGGRVVAQGSPTEIASVGVSRTGAALRRKSPNKVLDEVKMAVKAPRGDSSTPSAEELARFSGFLHEHYSDEPAFDSLEDNSEPTYAPIHPTYKLRDAEFPPKRLSVLQALRFTSPLDELLQPILRYEPESRDIIWASEEELPAIAAKFGLPGARIAWSLASDLATEGGATRSALPMLLRHAAETGAQHWTDQTGAQHPIDDCDFGKSDPFHVRVLIDKVVVADNLRRGMQLGSGWACVLVKSAAGLWRVKAHIANRPLSLIRRRLARRALLTGLSQNRGVNACPFCAGSGKESVCDESLICAAADRSLTDSLFFAPGARSLLQPVAGRIQRTLVFLQQEGVVDLVSPRNRWQPCDEQILRHGYPWARFPIPGRSTRKQVDFYEWQGLLPLVLNRLHLSKDLRWRSALTASVREQTCSFCEGSGINWPALNTTISGKALNEFLKEATFKSLSAMIEEMVPPHHTLHRCIQDACQIGLAHVRIQQSCGDLTAENRRNVRLLALRYAALAEAGYLMSEDDSATCASLRREMKIAF